MCLLSTLFFGLFTSLYLVLYAYPFHITSNNRSSYHAWTVSLPVRFRLEFEYNDHAKIYVAVYNSYVRSAFCFLPFDINLDLSIAY